MKCLEKKLDGKYKRMLCAVLNKSKEQHPTKQQLYSYLPPISQAIQIRQPRYSGYCWKSRDRFTSNTLQWTPTHGHTSFGWPEIIYMNQLCMDTRYRVEVLPSTIANRCGWEERIKGFHAADATCSLWYWLNIFLVIQLSKSNRDRYIFFMAEWISYEVDWYLFMSLILTII